MTPTKDPHVALIDAREKLDAIKRDVKQAVALAQAKAGRGGLTPDDKAQIKAIQAAALERTKRVLHELHEELTSHGLGGLS